VKEFLFIEGDPNTHVFHVGPVPLLSTKVLADAGAGSSASPIRAT
jgi:hypothetical protein